MAEIRWTEESLRWLEDIYEYVSAEDSSAASRILQGIFDRTQDALDFPEIGYRYSPQPGTSAYYFTAITASRIWLMKTETSTS